MAIASASEIARARAAAASQKRSSRGPRYQYPDLDRPRQFQLQLRDVTIGPDKFGKPEYGGMKVKVHYVVTLKGWETAKTKEEQDAFKARQHGRYVSDDYNPVISAPGVRSTGEAIKPSNLYKDLCVLLNDGKPLTDEQLDTRDGKGLIAWAKEWNKTAKERGEDELALSDEVLIREYHRMAVLAKLLREVEQRKPQVLAMLSPYTIKTGERAGQQDVHISMLVSLAEDLHEPWHPYERPYDPREDGDDPACVCTVTGERIRGWEGNEGWMSNKEWAAKQTEKLGAAFRLVVDGKSYAPPFSSKTYNLALEQWKQAKVESGEPTAPAQSSEPGF